MGTHSLAKECDRPSLEATPLMRIVLRPIMVSACGNDESSFSGESGDSSLVEYPPGNSFTC